MTGLIDTLERPRHPMQTTDPTRPQGVLERPTQPSAGPRAPEPRRERPSRPLDWVATLARRLRHQWDADVSAASMQALEMMTRCSTTTRR